MQTCRCYYIIGYRRQSKGPAVIRELLRFSPNRMLEPFIFIYSFIGLIAVAMKCKQINQCKVHNFRPQTPNQQVIVTNVFAYIKMTVLGCQVKWCNKFLHNGIYVIRVFMQDFHKKNMPIFTKMRMTIPIKKYSVAQGV